jgi:hypothetical protein
MPASAAHVAKANSAVLANAPFRPRGLLNIHDPNHVNRGAPADGVRDQNVALTASKLKFMIRFGRLRNVNGARFQPTS